MTSPQSLKANIENSTFSNNSMSPPTPASPIHKDKQSVFRDISNECSPSKTLSSSQVKQKPGELVIITKNALPSHSVANDPLPNISFVDMVVRVLEKNQACASQSSPMKNAMHFQGIIDELAIEFPFLKQQPREVWRLTFQKVLRTAYFFRTRNERGESCWSFNKKRYLQRIRQKTPTRSTQMHTKFTAMSTRQRSSVRNTKTKTAVPSLIHGAVKTLTVAELTLSVFLKVTSSQGYTANEILQGIKILFPTRCTVGLHSTIEEELSHNTLYSEVPSICNIKLYKLKVTNIEKLISEHHHLLEKSQKNPIQLANIGGNLHRFCKRWCEHDDKEIPEEVRGETELTKLHILTGVLLISPPGMSYTLQDIIERAWMLYPNHSIPNMKLDLPRQLYLTNEIERRSFDNKKFYYYIDPEVYPKYEARRIFLQNRLSVLKLSEKKINYLLTGRKYIISPSGEFKPRPEASRILAEMGLGKRSQLPSFRKRKVNEAKQSQTTEIASNHECDHAGSTAESRDAQEESKQESIQTCPNVNK